VDAGPFLVNGIPPMTPAVSSSSSASPAAAQPPPDAAPLIQARELRQSFRIGDRSLDVLRGVSLDVRAGEAVFLVGASGAGKTTLLYTLAGLERPASGSVVFEGKSIYDLDRRAQSRLRNARMGFIFQGYFLLPELTAFENVLLPAMIGGNAKARAALAAESLRAVGLADRMHHLPLELSGGEQQRVAIARALINEPSIVFADEPTGNLDSRSGHAVMDLLLALAREKRKTLLVVTHDMTLADCGDRKLEMRDGLLEA
jgi:predicted ABC-type transport system involved in lysophospholipase L1 biosynthesis ATPase subunit